MYRKVLIPLDGFELAESILNHIIEMASVNQVSEVILLTVVEGYEEGRPSTTWGGVKSVEHRAALAAESVAEAREYLEKVANKLKKKGMVVYPVVIRGRVAEEILDYATENQVDLIMMSTHGRSGPSRWALGSIADRVIRHSPVPVFIVSPKGGRTS